MIEAYEEVTIQVAAGTYNENITIDKRPVSIEGTGADTIIDGGVQSGQDVIMINGVQGVAISGLTIQNGNDGIFCKSGSACELKNITVQDCADEGIEVSSNSSAVISDFTVLGVMGGSGIGIGYSSSAIFEGAIVSKYNYMGILVFGSSTIICSLNSTTNILSENNRVGIRAWDTSGFYADSDTTMTLRNNAIGFEVLGSSAIEILGSLLVEDSGNRGISIRANSGFTISRPASVIVSGTTGEGVGIVLDDVSSLKGIGSGELIVENNLSNGIYVLRGSSFQTQGNFSAQFRNNGSNGIIIEQNATGRLRYGAVIQNNTDDGIRVLENSMLFATDILIDNNGRGLWADDGSTAWCRNSTINGNTGDDVILSFGSRASLYKGTTGTIGTISCDGTELIRGDYACSPPPP